MNDITSLCALLVVRGAAQSIPFHQGARAALLLVREHGVDCQIVRQLLEGLPADRVEELEEADELERRREELLAQLGGLTPDPTQEADTIRNATATRQGPNEAAGLQPRPARVHLVVGPVGAGKSTFALKLAQDNSAIRLTLDEWMVTLFRPDRPETDRVAWYRERAKRCIDQIWRVALQLTAQRHDVVLEIGLLQRQERQRFYARVDEAELALTVHVLDAARDVRRERVQQRNREQGPTFSMVVPPEIFELASDFWEPPDSDECEGRDVRSMRTDGHGAAG